MAPRSKIARLPEELRAQIHRMVESGLSVDEIKEHLNKLSVDVGRSAVGEYARKHREAIQAMRDAAEIARAIGQSFQDLPEDRVPRLNSQILHTLINKVLLAEVKGESVEIKAQDVHFLARALKDTNSAVVIDVDHKMKLRAQAKEEERQEAARRVVDAGRLKGWSAEFVQGARAAILGVPEPEK